jgi:hypothetical protein
MPERSLTDIEILKRIDEAKAKSIGVSRGYTNAKNITTLAVAQARALRLPLASVVFLTPVLTYNFAVASTGWSLYTDEDTGDSYLLGTVTATPKSFGVPDPEMTGLKLDAEFIDARNLLIYKIIPPAYASAPDVGYVALKASPIGGGSYSDLQLGELIISFDANGGNTRIKVENSDHYGMTPLLDWTSTGVARATGVDILITNIAGVLTIKYRAYGTSPWTTACTDTYQTNIQILSWAVQKHTFGGADNTMSILSIVADGADAANAYNGFIPSISYNGLNKDSIYVRLSDSSWLEIVPDEKDIVLDITSGLLYQWNGTTWVIYTHVLATDTALGAMHTMSGGVLGALLRASDATHANFQRITINQPNDLNGVAGAVTDNFFSADANQLPADSGYNHLSFISSSLSGTPKRVITRQAAGTWLAQDPQRYAVSTMERVWAWFLS